MREFFSFQRPSSSSLLHLPSPNRFLLVETLNSRRKYSFFCPHDLRKSLVQILSLLLLASVRNSASFTGNAIADDLVFLFFSCFFFFEFHQGLRRRRSSSIGSQDLNVELDPSAKVRSDVSFLQSNPMLLVFVRFS